MKRETAAAAPLRFLALQGLERRLAIRCALHACKAPLAISATESNATTRAE